MATYQGSWSEKLASLKVGDYAYYETTFDRYNNLMRRLNPPLDRRPPEIRDMRFTTALYTAVGPAASDVRYLVRVERIA